jgi:hypothetical protein
VCAPAELISPAQPNQSPVDFNGDHLEGYDYPTTVPPSFPTIKGVKVTNVFGTITGDVKGTPDRLLVPTTKCIPGGPPCTLQPPNPPTIHHFQCYPFINTKGDGKSATGVVDEDQFSQPNNLGPFKIGGSLLLCASTNKITPTSGPNGEDPVAVTNPTYLLCYQGSPRFGFSKVDLANQFATLDTQIDNYDEFCVNSPIQ